MYRLTDRDEYGNADIIALSDIMPEIYAGLSFSETNALTDALNRLAAYEDTGLTPEEVKRLQRHGHWIEEEDIQICSECGEEHSWQDYRASYCDNCGAKMDGGEENG